jgi:hypothetical protein
VTERLPIACTLSPDELRARRDDLLPGLAARAAQVIPILGGIQLHIASSPDAMETIGRVIDAERRCCRFLAFAVSAEPDLGPIIVTVTAPPDAQALLTDLVAKGGVD